MYKVHNGKISIKTNTGVDEEMSNEGIPVWDIEEPDIDLGDLVLEDENDALAANRTREMKRSVHAWLCFHSGLFAEWGLTHDAIDESAVSSSQRMQSEGHYRWDSAVETRRSAMHSLRTQLGDEITPSPIIFDAEGIALGYNLPGFSDIPEADLRVFNERFDGDAGCGYESWGDFCNYYRNLASYLVYDLSAVLKILEDLLPDYLPQIDQAWVERQQNRHYRQPSIQVVGVHCDRDRTVDQALSARELGRLVRVHGQITMLSPRKTQYITAAFHCSRCEDPKQLVPQNRYDDDMLFPLPCSVQGHNGLRIFLNHLSPPLFLFDALCYKVRRSILIACGASRIPTGIDRPNYRWRRSDSCWYVRSRPMNKTSSATETEKSISWLQALSPIQCKLMLKCTEEKWSWNGLMLARLENALQN